MRDLGCFHSSCWLIKRSRSTSRLCFCDLLTVCSRPTLWVKPSSADPGPASADPERRVWESVELSSDQQQTQRIEPLPQEEAGLTVWHEGLLQPDVCSDTFSVTVFTEPAAVEICCWSETAWLSSRGCTVRYFEKEERWCQSAWTESSCCSRWLLLVSVGLMLALLVYPHSHTVHQQTWLMTLGWRWKILKSAVIF